MGAVPELRALLSGSRKTATIRVTNNRKEAEDGGRGERRETALKIETLDVVSIWFWVFALRSSVLGNDKCYGLCGIAFLECGTNVSSKIYCKLA